MGDPEVAADVGDDLGQRPLTDLLLQVRQLQPLRQFPVEPLRPRPAGRALDHVLHIANDPLACGNALRPGPGPPVFVLAEILHQHHRLADVAGGAVERRRGGEAGLPPTPPAAP
jgi:hypothetical protein